MARRSILRKHLRGPPALFRSFLVVQLCIPRPRKKVFWICRPCKILQLLPWDPKYWCHIPIRKSWNAGPQKSISFFQWGEQSARTAEWMARGFRDKVWSIYYDSREGVDIVISMLMYYAYAIASYLFLSLLPIPRSFRGCIPYIWSGKAEWILILH